MLSLITGVMGFVLLLLYDINSFTGRWPPLRFGFWTGSVLIVAATAIDIFTAWRDCAFSGTLDAVLIILSIASFAALIYSLFFALPFDATYKAPVSGRKTYTYGIYAICRHPGIICFFVMYLFLGLAALPSRFIVNGMIFSTLNTAYAWFQDRITFPRTFCDYDDYRRQVPFIIPTTTSIRRAIKTWGRPYGKEEEL